MPLGGINRQQGGIPPLPPLPNSGLSMVSAAVLEVANALRLQVPDVVWNPIDYRETFWSTRKSDLQRELVKRCYYSM